MLLWLYRFLSFLAAPPLLLFLKKRQRNKKEHDTRLQERWGITDRPRPAGTLIWVHAASVGEAQSALPLIHRLRETYPAAQVMLTTGTVSSEAFISPKLPAGAFHQFVPVDTWQATSRFLAHWKPDVALWMESELWPNLLQKTKASGCRLALINARMSERSCRTWQRFPHSIRSLLGCFDVVSAQSEKDAARLTALGAHHVLTPGNLKQDAECLPADADALAVLEALTADRPVWVAASTHSGEEPILAAAHQRIVQSHPDLLTIIVPRHPPRGEKIAAELADTQLNIALRSQADRITPQTHIYIADTIGELGLFYRLSGIVFMGGSLIPHGGQNPLEAARLECALLVGEHTHNFSDIYAQLEEKQAVTRAKNAESIATTVTHWLNEPAEQHQRAQAALQVVQSQQGALAATLNAITPLITRRSAA